MWIGLTNIEHAAGLKTVGICKQNNGGNNGETLVKS
jgi:hypothetical protein